MELLIDTTIQGLLIFELQDGKRVIARVEKQIAQLSEQALVELQKFLKHHKLTVKDLSAIRVNPGPGGFSSTRSGVAIGNALAYALEIPVAEYPSGRVKDTILPKYDKMPNITRAKQESRITNHPSSKPSPRGAGKRNP